MGRRAKHIFISYSRDDKTWTYEFAKALREELGLSVFVDYKGIHIGVNWWRTICENIESCDYVIYIMSPMAIDSIYCTAEIEYALALNKPILPIMFKPCKFPDKLSKKQVQYLALTDAMQIAQILIELQKGLADIRELIFEGEYKAPNPLPTRPNEPQPKDSKSAEEVYFIALDMMNSHDFDQAMQLFQQVVSADGHGQWGELAQLRFDEVKSYQAVARLAERSMRDARVLWHKHVAKFGDEFDPFGLHQQLGQSTPQSVRTTFLSSAPEIETPPKIITPTKPKIILPQPFDWCYIPEGDVTLTSDAPDSNFYIKSNTLIREPAFWMSKYPATNAQFAEFIKDGGYKNDQWWTKAGIAQRDSDKWTQPRYWTDKKWNGAEQPVVGVSWYEAMAFCNWLSHKINARIILPSDAQWQRAAQGDDGREYPWGNGWNGDWCNNSVRPHDSNQTTPVHHYEGKGDSPFGVVDMAGNVWEWCSTMYLTGNNNLEGTDVRVLRGGSWYYLDTLWFRASFRSWYYPHVRNDNSGFRFCSLL